MIQINNYFFIYEFKEMYFRNPRNVLKKTQLTLHPSMCSGWEYCSIYHKNQGYSGSRQISHILSYKYYPHKIWKLLEKLPLAATVWPYGPIIVFFLAREISGGKNVWQKNNFGKKKYLMEFRKRMTRRFRSKNRSSSVPWLKAVISVQGGSPHFSVRKFFILHESLN